MREQQLALVPVGLGTSEPAGAGGDTSGTARTAVLGLSPVSQPSGCFSPGPQGDTGTQHFPSIQVHGQPARRHGQQTLKESGKKTAEISPTPAGRVFAGGQKNPAPMQMFLLPCCPFERLKHLAASEGVPEALPNESRDTPPPPRRNRYFNTCTYTRKYVFFFNTYVPI